MPLGTLQFRSLLTNLSHNVRRDAGTLLSRIGHLTAREGRAFITEAWPELIRPYIDLSGDLTVEWYDGQPTTNTVFVPQPADPPPDEQLAANGRWAVGQDDPRDALGGAGERAVFNASRDTVLDNVIREDGARWVREARPGACNFCKLMTTRGAVYWSEASALTVTGRTVNIELSDRRAIAAGQMTRAEAMARRQFYRSEREAGKAGVNVGDMRVGALRGTRDYGESYHDECRCLAVMIRPGRTYEVPEYAQSWEQDYINATTAAEKQLANRGEHRALTVKDVVNAWDRNERQQGVVSESIEMIEIELTAANGDVVTKRVPADSPAARAWLKRTRRRRN